MEAQTRPYDRTAMSTVAVENARLQWEDGYRRLSEHASRPADLSASSPRSTS